MLSISGRSRVALIAVTLSVAFISTVYIKSVGWSRESSTTQAFSARPSSSSINERILVVTRVHVTSAQNLATVKSVTSFSLAALEHAHSVLICVGAHMDVRDSYLLDLNKSLSEAGLTNKTHILVVDPWGGFTHALNLAVSFAIDNKYDLIAFQVPTTPLSDCSNIESVIFITNIYIMSFSCSH
jgi:hypothetical protein